MAAAPPSLAAPPTAPDVADQQGSFSQFAQSSPQGEQAGSSASAMSLVTQKLNQVASTLKDIAKVLAMTKPNLLPLLEHMVKAGSGLMNEIQGAQPQAPGQQQGPPGASQRPPEPPAPPQGGGPPEGAMPGM